MILEFEQAMEGFEEYEENLEEDEIMTVMDLAKFMYDRLWKPPSVH